MVSRSSSRSADGLSASARNSPTFRGPSSRKSRDAFCVSAEKTFGLFVAPLAVVLHRLEKSNLLQLPLKLEGRLGRPLLPPVLAEFQGERLSVIPAAAPPKKRRRRPPPSGGEDKRADRSAPHLRYRTEGTLSRVWGLSNETPGPVAESDWMPALQRLARGADLKLRPRGTGFYSPSQPVSKLLTVLNTGVLGRWLLRAASLELLVMRSSWGNREFQFPMPAKARLKAELAGHRAWVKHGHRGLKVTDEALDISGVPSYVIRKKFCSLSSKQKGLATYCRLTQLLLNRGAVPRARGTILRVWCSGDTGPTFEKVRIPPRNWRRALRLAGKQVVSTYASHLKQVPGRDVSNTSRRGLEPRPPP